ncbi:MAG: OprD family outer membrane porin [Flavitalea sp.]
MKKIISVFIGLLSFIITNAQHQEISQQPEVWKGKENNAIDSSSLLYAFKKGTMHGHLRYFFMGTENASGLADYYANALGGGIKYETAPFKGFQLGVSGFFVFNVGSSDLSKPDPKTNQLNRYEIGLFDIEDPNNKSDIDRLEEFYIKYNWKNSFVRFGRQLINTPFINLQDGRMRPTEVGGIWVDFRQLKNLKIEGGYLYEVSPRSTVEWYKAGESIGIYPTGINPDGTKSGYAGNLESKGIAILDLAYKVKNDLTLKIGELYVENIFNSTLLQADYQHELESGSKLNGGVQFIHQFAVKDGGNKDQSKSYFQKDDKAQTFGAKIGFEKKRWQTSLNYNRITKDGRYLMPREWGRDPFYTFLPRERNEGLGDVHAYVAKFGYSFPKQRVKANVAAGYFDLPEVNNVELNKYGMPSYTQLNIDLRYEFNGVLKGLESQLLYVYKGKSGNEALNEKYIINKVDMNMVNLVLNYHF